MAAVAVFVLAASALSLLPPQFLFPLTDDLASTFNQVLVLGLFASLLILEFIRPNPRLGALLVSLWPLIALIVMALISVSWSDYPMVSLRRAIRLAAYIGIVLLAVSRYERPLEAFHAVFWAGVIALCLSIIMIATGEGRNALGLTGIFLHKNSFGLAAACLTLISLGSALQQRGLIRTFAFAVTVAWFIFVFASGSKTSAAAILVALSLGLPLAFIARRFGTLGPAPLVLTLGFFSLAAVAFMEQSAFLGFINLDEVTFTGRTKIWGLLKPVYEANWLFGVGYGGLWNVGQRGFIELNTNNFITDLRQAHSGYVEVALTLGLAGYALLTMTYYKFWLPRAIPKESVATFYPMLLFGAFHNLQETQFLRTDAPGWFFMLIVVVALHSSTLVQSTGRKQT